jgi:GT2 family glycosyltransferase
MKKHEKSGGLLFKNCLPLCIISPSSVIIHRSVFEDHGLFDESLPVCEDYDLWLRFCAFLPILYLEKPQIIKYGGHSDQLSHKYWGMDRFRIIALEKLIENPALSSENKLAAIQTLLEKIDIYIQGAKKRGKVDEVDLYEKKQDKYKELLDNFIKQPPTPLF